MKTGKRFSKTITALLIGSFASVTSAASDHKLNDVFNGSMLGVNQRYFESVAGIPRETFGDENIFIVDSCKVTAFITDQRITALRLEIDKNCRPDLPSFMQGFAPKSASIFGIRARPLTFGAFSEAAGPLRFFADCLTLCGNAVTPVVSAHWSSPHAVDFMEAMLEVQLMSDPAIAAASHWRNVMQNKMGIEYVRDTLFNCEDRFSTDATGLAP